MIRQSRSTRRIAAKAETVWSVLADHEGMSSWGPGVDVVLERAGVSERDGVGAIRRVRMAGLMIRELVTDFVPGQLLGYRCISGIPLRDYRGEVRLVPEGDSTVVTWTLSAATRSALPAAMLAVNSRVFLTVLARAVRRASSAASVQIGSPA